LHRDYKEGQQTMIINSSKHFALQAKAFTQGPQVQVFSYMNKIEYNNIKLQ